MPLLGPFAGIRMLGHLQLIRFLPALRAQPPFQHTYRIYILWNITRTNAVLVPLGGLWAGVVLGTLRGLDRRRRVWLTIVVLWSVWFLLVGLNAAFNFDRVFHQHLATNPASWLPLPLVPAALTLLVVMAMGVPEMLAWPCAGIIFAICMELVWGPHAGAAVLGIGSAITISIGALAGARLAGVMRHMTRRAVISVAALGVVVPFITGTVDLYLRRMTP